MGAAYQATLPPVGGVDAFVPPRRAADRDDVRITVCAVCDGGDMPMVPCGHVCQWCFAAAQVQCGTTLRRWMRMHGVQRDDGATDLAAHVRRGCPCCGAQHAAWELFRPEERGLWTTTRRGRRSALWQRRAEGRTPAVALEVRASEIQGAGRGLFATRELAEGTPLGRLSGRVLFSGAKGACEDWAVARAGTRSVLLRHARAWAVVDVRGSPFEFVNKAEDVLHVSECGAVECARDVAAGEELVWDYGELYGL